MRSLSGVNFGSSLLYSSTTNMATTTVLYALLVLSSVHCLLHRCPMNAGNGGYFHDHCVCTKSLEDYKVNVTCQAITSDQLLGATLSQLLNHSIDSLTIKGSGPLSLSPHPFRRLNIHRVAFQETEFPTASIFRGFTGLEFTLEEIHFVRCNVAHWSWGDGRRFVHLKTVRFENTALPEILTSDEVFRHFPKNIRTLQINGCSVKRLGNIALKRFSHLQCLELSRNKIASIQRSMFSPHLRRLQRLSLSQNPLRSISTDTFVNMPRLEFLFLSSVRLPSLKSETFSPVWDQLEEIDFEKISLICDCDSKWMLDVPDFKKFKPPFCSSHSKLLNQLTRSEKSQLCS